MTLPMYADAHGIDLSALARVRKRVMLVGRFNADAEPSFHLFTNRPAADLPPPYTARFASVRPLRYDEFVAALGPRMTEAEVPSGRFTAVVAGIPLPGTPGGAIIDRHNWFFRRAVQTSAQPDFAAERGQQPFITKDLLPETDDPGKPYPERRPAIQARGQAIFLEVRAALKAFAAFQPRIPEIADTFAILLAHCAGQNGLPFYSSPQPLPRGVPAALVSFVFDENDRRDEFPTDGIDPAGTAFATTDLGGTFTRVVKAYRDALLENNANQNGDLKFNGYTLDQWAAAAVQGVTARELPAKMDKRSGLRAAVQAARRAFNGLRQILRSRVLLSYVLEWVLAEYYTPKFVGHIAGGSEADADRDAAVEALILNGRRTADGGTAAAKLPDDQQEQLRARLGDDYERKLAAVPVPVQRVSEGEREKLMADFTAQFGQLVRYVLDGDRARLDGMSDDLAGWARALHDDPAHEALRQSIRLATGFGEPDHERRLASFLAATELSFRDVLFPALFQRPVVSAGMLRKEFGEGVLAAYQATILMSPAGTAAFTAVGEAAAKALRFDTNKRLANRDEVLGVMHRGVLPTVAAPQVAEQLAQAQREIREALALMDGKGGGAGDVAALRPYRAQGLPLSTVSERTAIANRGTRGNALRVIGEVLREPPLAAGAPADPPALPPADFEGQVRARALALRRADNPPPEGALRRQLEDEFTGEDTLARLDESRMRFGAHLHRIYKAYADPATATRVNFLNLVEKLTLTNLMLLFQDEIGLGQGTSNLLQMLSDLILHLDRGKPSATDLIGKVSLTRYFEEDQLRINPTTGTSGLTELRVTLSNQGVNSLENVVSFVSELRGVEYLFRKLETEPGAELIVMNASAAQFQSWVQGAHLVGGAAGPWQAGLLSRPKDNPAQVQQVQSAAPVGLVYLTKTAGTADWVGFPLAAGALRTLVPPVCVDGTPPEGAGYVCPANGVAPVVVVGPSVRINPRSDGFPTEVQAGYLFALHYLRPAAPIGLNQEMIPTQSRGRYRVVAGIGGLQQALRAAVWQPAEPTSYCFAIDHYLHLVMLLAATGSGILREPLVKSKPPPAQPAPGSTGDLSEAFHWIDVAVQANFHSGAGLNPAMLPGSVANPDAPATVLQLSLDQPLQDAGLASVKLTVEGPPDRSNANNRAVACTDVAWFNAAREAGEFF